MSADHCPLCGPDLPCICDRFRTYEHPDWCKCQRVCGGDQ